MMIIMMTILLNIIIIKYNIILQYIIIVIAAICTEALFLKTFKYCLLLRTLKKKKGYADSQISRNKSDKN